MDLWGTLKEKHFGVPTWVIAVVGTIALALWLQRKNSKSSDKAAADQTSTDLGTASNLANLFNVAGMMPYQGGDVYVTVNAPGNSKPPVPNPKPKPKPKPPTPGKKPPVKSTPPKEIVVRKDDTLSAIAKRYGLTWQELYQYNISKGPKGANRPDSTIQTLKKRGPNYLVSGEKIDIPKKGTVYAGGY